MFIKMDGTSACLQIAGGFKNPSSRAETAKLVEDELVISEHLINLVMKGDEVLILFKQKPEMMLYV
jgi:hypothetical protein